jgi:queuine tRNA-ribosyltransferase
MSIERIQFEVVARSGAARLGRLLTPHGVVETPAFMPVGTLGTVKALHPIEVSETGARLLIANTYHLWLRPGAETVAEQGGLHEFMRWPHAIATDSGGFQAYSLAQRVRVDEAGYEFSSHIDGSRRRLTPEESMRVQGLLGSDIALSLDVCPPAGVSPAQLRLAVERTTRWTERCLTARKPSQALFGIIQGGTDVDLRLWHAETLGRLPVDGLALGGFSVGEPPEVMYQVLERVVPNVDAARPRYLMGVGTPIDLVRAMATGVDLFDCVLPTRNARNGQAFVRRGRLTVKNARFRTDSRPLDETCGCPVCQQGFSRAYLRHLYVAGEILGHRLLSLHNLHHYASLMASARRAISEGQFESWVHERSQDAMEARAEGDA